MIYEDVFNFEPFEYGLGSSWSRRNHEVYIYESPTEKSHHMEVKMSSDLVRESGIKGKSVSIYRDHEVFKISPDKNGKLTVKDGGRFGGNKLAKALKEATGKTTFKGEATTDGSVIFR